jgi:hypothetical protein
MGIDIRVSWPGQTDDERAAQITGFSIAHGHVGYLREAYHGEPYATRVLVPEAFEDTDEAGAPIPAFILRERLPHALEVATERERAVYGHDRFHPDTRATRKSFRDFVDLCERQEKIAGEPCRISASY